jgi:hypothetical protein
MGIETRMSSAHRVWPMDCASSSVHAAGSSAVQSLGEILAAARRGTEPSGTSSAARKQDDMVFVAAGHEDSYLKAQQELLATSKKSMHRRTRTSQTPVVYSDSYRPRTDVREGGGGGPAQHAAAAASATATKMVSIDSSYNSGSSTCDETDSRKSSPTVVGDENYCVIAEPKHRAPAPPCRDTAPPAAEPLPRSPVLRQQDIPADRRSVEAEVETSLASDGPSAAFGVCDLSAAKSTFMVAVPGANAVSISPLTGGTGVRDAAESNTRLNATLPMGRGQRLQMLLSAATRRPGSQCSSFNDR